MHKIAIYPGTFDPLTNGHIGLIRRAAALFETVIVAIATSAHKTPFFSLNERIQMAEAVLKGVPNVQVKSFQGLLVDYAREHNATVILRGLRAVSDFDYEFQMAGMNRQMAPDIETVFLPASEETAFISATMIREIVALGGDVSQFVPAIVVEHLQEKN